MRRVFAAAGIWGFIAVLGIVGTRTERAWARGQGTGLGNADFACLCYIEPGTRGRFEIRGEVGPLANHTCQQFCVRAIQGED